MIPCLNIAWVAIRELLYERVFYVLVSFAGLSLCLSLMLGQLTYTAQSKLTLDFMLGAIELSMVLFSIFMGISLFHRELTSGSVSMILSKPISRASFLVGKYLGQVMVQGAVTFGMACIAALISWSYGSANLAPAIFQASLLIFFEVTVITALTYFFAVNAGGITTAVAALILFFIGHLGEAIATGLREKSETTIWTFVRGVVPDLELFNMKSLASYGLTIGTAEMGWIAVYAASCTVFFLAIAILCFQRRDILT